MIELPPLPSLPSRSFADHERYIIQLRDVMKARERILMARIAELEADTARYRYVMSRGWLPIKRTAGYFYACEKNTHYPTAVEAIDAAMLDANKENTND